MTHAISSVAAPVFIPINSRRVCLRVAANFAVQLAIGSSRSDFIMARAVDIGMGGLCVRAMSIIDQSRIRAVRFSLGPHQLDLEVESRWSSQGEDGEGLLTGLSFRSTNAAVETAIWTFIQDRGRELGSFIRSCEGLSSLSFEEALELALETRLREVECGQLIYGPRQGMGGASIFLNLEGTALLERVSESRSEKIATVHAGAIFGGLPIVAGYPPIERAVAVSDVTLLEFDQFSCEYMIGAKPLLAAALLRAASFHWMCRLTRLIDRTWKDAGHA